MFLRIDAIETAGPDKRARRLFLSQGEPRLTSAAVVRVLDLEPGLELDSAELNTSLEEHESACARERALRVLGYRERSERELEQRLIDDGYPEGLAREVKGRLVELGLLDDERFASLWVRTRTAAGFGSTRIARELKDKGVAPAIIEAALAEASESGDEVERARAVLGSRIPHDRKERERLVQKLLRRGFSLSVALKAVPGIDGQADAEF